MAKLLLLWVLDNFDHVLAGAALVGHILQTAAGVKVLVTSRERLNLAHEIRWPIGRCDGSGALSFT